MQDPFYVVKEEVQQSVQGVVSLYERWKQLLETTNTATNEEFKWTQNELKTGLRSIEWDLNDLEETISVVQNNQNKFRLDGSEIENRRGFVAETKKKIQQIKDDLGSTKTKGKVDKDSREVLMATKAPAKTDKLTEAIVEDNQQFINGQQQRMQLIEKEQDKKMDIIKENVVKLKEIGHTIGSTLEEHDELLGQIDTEVSSADKGLKGAIKQVSQLLDRTKDSTQWGIIILLILALVGLLVLVFYV